MKISKLSFTVIGLLFGVLTFTSCKNKNEGYQVKTEVEISDNKPHPGKKIMETKCYLCHSPSADHDGSIAPPMVAIKSHYLNDDTTKKEFGDAIWNFLQKPSEEKSRMPGAVRRFGVMPYQVFSEEEIRLIADYMYEFKIEEPKWFKQHIEEKGRGRMQYRNDGKIEKNTIGLETKDYKEIGLKYALGTKKVLGKNLMGTIQKKGVVAALEFCNEKAYTLTDSMATVYNAQIKRVSDKPRNPLNRATAEELEYIEIFKNKITNDEGYEPITVETDKKTHFYYPITTNLMCLQCHGKPKKDVQSKTLNILANLYPDDKALGYDINQVRGIWSISFEK
ncbi:DUF3365 domain-containing protein [Aquimarina sp. MAR_2010_214]|uniref:c-type heme family protein n=1 Tax=Aquimarina sp. MAR_2010_214 TaxID=1250026 RepID=UPI000C70572D|nr:DUF3365 domain-containing protein [Aquimarina sp. MAR_2010_214]